LSAAASTAAGEMIILECAWLKFFALILPLGCICLKHKTQHWQAAAFLPLSGK